MLSHQLRLGHKASGILLATSLVLSSALITAPVQAQVYPPEGTITTTGHGEVRVKPDSLSVSVMVESTAKTIAAAREDNNRKMQQIISALKNLNIPNLKLETQNVSVYPIQEYPPAEPRMSRDRLPKTVGYRASNSVNVIVTNAPVDMLGEYGSRIIDTALNAQANNVGGLNFYLTDMQVPRMQSLEAAVKDARKNAETMARAADVNLSGVYSIEGSPQFGGYPRPMPMYAMKGADMEQAAAPAVPVETGETTVTSDVTVRFKF